MTDKDTMKQIAQNYKSGELTVLDAPVPACRPGGVLVQSLFSLISTGTEMMKVHEANLSMVGKARARPDQVRKVLDTVAQQGAMATYKKVMNKLDSYTPLGYSLCGVVIEVGAGAEEFKVGQLVAAAGNEFALHAEYNWIPVNLCAAVPRGVAPEHAAFATVGAIAMQGVRRAEPQLGETSLVIGLGLIGQLVVRLLVAAGIRVVGLDMIEARCRLAEQAGAVACAAPDDEGLAAVAAALDELTSGRGADHVFLAAGGSSNAPVETAAKLARDRARVVDIGKTKLDLPWNAYYDKELDVRFSRSYGPGRYDDRYELEGVDYPAGYVRWTERRNLECFLDLLARKDLEVETLVSGTFPMHDAVSVYADLSSGALKAVGVLLSYPAPDPETLPRPAASLVRAASRPPRPGLEGAERAGSKRLAIGFIGAGNYASSMLLPHLAQLPNAELVHVTTTKSLSAVNAQRRFGFTTASTSASAVLEDESLDAIFVVTRHATHADLVCRALETGKAVFVEKPLALTAEELDRITEVIAKTGNDRLMVGFNRRFAPMLAKMKADFGPASSGCGHPLPGQRGPARRGQLVPQRGRGVAVHRRGRSLPGHAQLVGGQPARGGLRGRRRPGLRRRPGHGAVRQRRQRRDQLPHRRQRALPQGDAGRHRRRPQRAAGQLPQGHGLVRARPRDDPGPGRPGQGAARRAGPFRRGLPGRRGHADPARVAGRHHQGDHRGAGQPAERQAGAGVSTAATSRLGWYARRAARMSPAEMAWRVRDQVVRAAWSPRQVTRQQLARAAPAAPARELAFTAVLPPGTAARVPEEARKPVLEAADRLLRGEWETLGVLRTDLERPDWFRDPVTGRRSDPDRYAFRVDHRSEEQVGNVKQVWEISRLQHLTLLATRLVPQPRRPVRAAGRRSAPLLVAGEPVPVRRALDERHRARHPPDQPGLDPAPAGRLAGRRRPVRAQRARGAADPLAPAVPRRVPAAAAPRPTTT